MSSLRKLLPWQKMDTPIKFECDNVLYAIYPFYQLCKFSVLCPLSIQKTNGNIRFRFSMKMLMYSVFALVIYIAIIPLIYFFEFWPINYDYEVHKIIIMAFTIACILKNVGFIHGIRDLMKQASRVPTIISHFSGWAQIYSLFSLASIDIVWSWITVPKLIRLIEQIQIIDSTIACKLSIRTAYNRYLKKLYIQITLLAIVPFCLSMVNCIILYERNLKFSSCFWFICFSPILIITLKQFQFYNFMFLLKSKIGVINSELRDMDGKKMNKMESATSIDSEQICLTQAGRAEDKLCEKLKDIACINVEVITATKTVLDLFSVHLFLITTTALGVITVQIYNFYALIIDYLYMDVFSIIATVAWIILQFGTVMKNVGVCNMIEEETIGELKKMAGIYADLLIVTRKIQEIFGLHLLLMISTSFLVLTIQTYNIFALLMRIIEMSPFRIFSAVAWMMVQSFAIVMNIHICSEASIAMSNTGPLLHNIQCLSDNRLVFQTAQMFSLQILHRNVNFTAAGFFNLDYKLITSIVAAVTTYLVIIIQFHIANTQNMNVSGMESKLNITNPN